MKTMVEIPESLFVVITKRAEESGQDFTSTLSDILRRGIEQTSIAEEQLATPILTTDSRTGFQVIEGGHPPLPGQELTPEKIAEILHEQEVAWHHAASRR
jgi:hypothetical protein